MELPHAQVLGDSFARRFGTFMAECSEGQEILVINQCIGLPGNTISQLKNFIKKSKLIFDSLVPLVLFIGTNDVLKGRSFQQIKCDLLSLLRFFNRTNPGIKLILNELPFYPRVWNSSGILRTIHQFNMFISTLQSPSVQVLRVPHTLNAHSEFYHYRYAHSRRIDQIHFNNSAYLVVAQGLKELISGEPR